MAKNSIRISLRSLPWILALVLALCLAAREVMWRSRQSELRQLDALLPHAAEAADDDAREERSLKLDQWCRSNQVSTGIRAFRPRKTRETLSETQWPRTAGSVAFRVGGLTSIGTSATKE